MSKTIKKILLVLLFTILMIFFYFRYVQLDSGYYSNRWDYGSHIGIISYIQDGNLFPELQKPQASYHAIASWMPVYHGILGTHFLTLFISLFGLSIPAAMLFLSDLALALIFYVLYKLSKNSWIPTIFTFCFVVLPGFVLMSYQGFFSMTVGSAIALYGLYLFETKKNRLSVFFLIFSFFCYPDSSIWIVAYFSHSFYQRRNEQPIYKYYSYALLLVGVALLAVFITRGFLPGAAEWPLTYLVALLLLTSYSVWKDPHFLKNSTHKFMLIYLMISLLTILAQIVLFQDLSIDYYPRKYTYWCVFFIALLVLRSKFPLALLGLCSLILIYGFNLEKEDWSVAFHHFYIGSGAFTTQQENEILELKKITGCKSWIHIPYFLSKDKKVNIKDIVYDIVFYSKMKSYDIYQSEIETDLLVNREDKFINDFLRQIAYADTSDQMVLQLAQKAQSLNNGHCFMVDKSRDMIFKDYLENQIKQTQHSSIYKF